MVYANMVPPIAIHPGNRVGTLTGSLNPLTSGIYTFTPAESLTLSPNTQYFIVLTAGTPVADGAYQWRLSAYPPSVIVWDASNAVVHSSDGISSWSSDPSAVQIRQVGAV
jgi:hypothetical protein